ncbi:MAG: 50S ribosomal protein L20 [Anaerofustis stercorihominis]|nr:50S ribosomal protein L20 [Anaerofustis stercorihominis]
MARIKRGINVKRKHKKVLKQAKGYYGAKSKLYRSATEAVMRAQRSAFAGRKQKKRDMRKLWIARINAAARLNDLSYSRMMHGLKVAGVNIDRKMLADLAMNDAAAFTALAETAKEALA